MPERIIAPKHPDDVAEEKTRTDLVTIRDNADRATTIQSLKAEVVRLTGIVEYLLGRVDK